MDAALRLVERGMLQQKHARAALHCFCVDHSIRELGSERTSWEDAPKRTASVELPIRVNKECTKCI